MNFKTIALSLAVAACSAASAHTVLLQEDFNSDSWQDNFPQLIEGDHLAPLSGINPIFMDKNGASQPWWTAKDASTSSDRFLLSHSLYQTAGASRDFVVSKPLTIQSEGFTLSFDAQSGRYLGGARLSSDLHLFILEEKPTEATLPTADKATRVYAEVPAGKDLDNFEGDFTHYEVNLDEWAGKTIYIAFANLNDSKDFLAIDNVLVQRLDIAELSASAPEYILKGNFPLDVTLKASTDKAIGPWTMTVTAGSFTATETGTGLTPGQEFKKSFEIPVAGDENLSWEVRVSSEGINDILASGSTHGMLFTPERRVLLEETTGTWCGNCPMGIYNIEEMEEDPNLKGKVIPVAVHIHDLSRSEPMVCTDYAAGIGIEVAPSVVYNRTSTTLFNPNFDCVYDPTNPSSIAGTITREQQRLSLAEVAIEQASIEQAADTPGAVKVTAAVTPAVTLDGTKYKLGFALTEDNVRINFDGLPIAHMNMLTFWIQHNYLAGQSFEGNLNGWTTFPQLVMSVPFQHVARAVKGFWGLAGSLPDAPLKGGEKYTFTTTIDIPDTYTERTSSADGKTYMTSPAVNPDNLNVVVYMVNTETGDIVNAAQVTANGEAHEIMDTKWLADFIAGVECIETPAVTGPAEYFTIEGLRVAAPVKGQLYIVRQGSETRKVIF